MAQIIDGKAIADKIKDEIVQDIIRLKGMRPNLAIILVGEREDSKLYVSLKEKQAKEVGIDTHTYKCPENIAERELFEMIDLLNKDELIDAILIQLPLPAGYDTDGIIMAIDPAKDVDGFHPNNLERLFNSCDHEGFIPPIINVVLEMLKSIKCELQWKKVCIVANSDLFGRAMAWVLKCQGAHTDVTSEEDEFFEDKISNADILISAVGKPKFIKKEILKANVVIIDIGISKQEDHICGDIDFDDVQDIASFITPVPGGVGPMTIALAFKNTLNLYKKRHQK